MNATTLVYPYNGILLSNTKMNYWNTVEYECISKRYTQRKKTARKEYTLYDSIEVT